MEDGGKRVSWVELYLDLVFVLAVGQLAHLIVGRPETHSVWIALGLFFTLWWTWVGFAVPAPFRYALWAIGIIAESGAMLTEDRGAVRRARRDRDLAGLQPTDPGE